MKKRAILALMLVFAFACPVNGAEIVETNFRKNWEEIVNTLEDTKYGGVYIDNGILHIKPVKNKEISVLKSRDTDLSKVIVDPIADYTIEQLKTAQENIFANYNELDINSIGLSNKYNSVIVTSTNWDEDKKQAVKEVAGIDNIIYEVLKDYKDIDFVPSESSDNTGEKPSLLQYPVGEKMHNNDRGNNQTLGACVKLGSASGFITTAHGNGNEEEANEMGGAGSDSYGVINKFKMGGSVDAVFVKKRASDNIDLTDKVMLSKNGHDNLGTITSAGGTPPLEGVVIKFGYTSGYSIAIVSDTSWSGTWDGNLDPNNTYRDMLALDLLSSEGDSGGPCLIPLGNDNYKLVGIIKGTKVDDNNNPLFTIATKWDNIEAEFGVSIYRP